MIRARIELSTLLAIEGPTRRRGEQRQNERQVPDRDGILDVRIDIGEVVQGEIPEAESSRNVTQRCRSAVAVEGELQPGARRGSASVQSRTRRSGSTTALSGGLNPGHRWPSSGVTALDSPS